jgi:hypothetical protein
VSRELALRKPQGPFDVPTDSAVRGAASLGQRLSDLGIQPGQARSTALFQLATELPAALLARMLGIHIDVATAWQRASAGDWMTYAADVSRRTQSTRQSTT